ncbi:MAG TPA: hypothetical protein VGM83_19665 [Devosiaceae bacterium]
MTGIIVSMMSGAGHAQDRANLEDVASVTGTCDKLIMAGDDLSPTCSGQMIQSIYNTGRTGFTVMVGDKGKTATFTGMEGAKPDDNSQLQTVDRVIVNEGIKGSTPSTIAATGSCAYTNPYMGPTIVNCQAVGDNGDAFLLQFRTDGSEPKFLDLKSSAAP